MQFIMSTFYINENGLVYGMNNNPIMATTHNENNKDLLFHTNEDNYLDLFNANISDLFDDLEESILTFSINAFTEETIDEATNIKLPLNSEKDLKNLNFYERLEKIDKIAHVNLWISPQMSQPDKYSSCWIWVELPKEMDGVKYVPIINHNAGGVSVHPYFHKYFLRNFDKRTRHLILGFCYIYGPNIAIDCNAAYKNKLDELPDSRIHEILYRALRYKDSDAPKRIDLGPDDDGNPRYKPSVNDYNRWLNSLKSR